MPMGWAQRQVYEVNYDTGGERRELQREVQLCAPCRKIAGNRWHETPEGKAL